MSKIQIVRYVIYTPASTTIQTGTIRPILYQVGDGQYRPYSETPKYYLDVNAQSDNLLNGDYLVEQSKLFLNNASLFMNRQTYRGRDCLFINTNNINLINAKFLKNRFKLNTRYYINLSMVSYDASALGKTGLWLGVHYTDGSDALLAVPNEKDEFSNTFFASNPNKTISYIWLTYAYYSKGYIDLDNSFICEEAIYNKSIINSISIDLDQPLRALPNGVSDYITQDGSVIRNVGFVDLGDITYLDYPSYNGYYARLVGLKVANYGEGICTSFKIIKSHGEMGIRIGSDNDYIYIEQVSDIYPSVAEFKSAMSGVKLFYELATPTTTPLTDEQKKQWNSLQRFNKKTHIYGNFKTAMIEYNRGLKPRRYQRLVLKIYLCLQMRIYYMNRIMHKQSILMEFSLKNYTTMMNLFQVV